MRDQIGMYMGVQRNFIKLALLLFPFISMLQVSCQDSNRTYYTFLIDTSAPLDKATSDQLAKYLYDYLFETIRNAKDPNPWLELKEISDPDADNLNFSVSLEGVFEEGTDRRNQLQKAIQKKPQLASFLLGLAADNFYNKKQRKGAVSPVYDTIFTTLYNNQKSGRKNQKYIIISDFLDNYIHPDFNKIDLNTDQKIFITTYGQKFQKFLDPEINIEVISIKRREEDPLLTKNAAETSYWIFSSQILYKTKPKMTPSFQYQVTGLPERL